MRGHGGEAREYACRKVGRREGDGADESLEHQASAQCAGNARQHVDQPRVNEHRSEQPPPFAVGRA